VYGIKINLVPRDYDLLMYVRRVYTMKMFIKKIIGLALLASSGMAFAGEKRGGSVSALAARFERGGAREEAAPAPKGGYKGKKWDLSVARGTSFLPHEGGRDGVKRELRELGAARGGERKETIKERVARLEQERLDAMRLRVEADSRFAKTAQSKELGELDMIQGRDEARADFIKRLTAMRRRVHSRHLRALDMAIGSARRLDRAAHVAEEAARAEAAFEDGAAGPAREAAVEEAWSKADFFRRAEERLVEEGMARGFAGFKERARQNYLEFPMNSSVGQSLIDMLIEDMKR
jgi:hypothetical protein